MAPIICSAVDVAGICLPGMRMLSNIPISHIRLTFLTGESWVDVSADLVLSGQFQHFITLQASEGNSRSDIKHGYSFLEGWEYIRQLIVGAEVQALARTTSSSSAAGWGDEIQSPSLHSLKGWNSPEGPDDYECPDATAELHGILKG